MNYTRKEAKTQEKDQNAVQQTDTSSFRQCNHKHASSLNTTFPVRHMYLPVQHLIEPGQSPAVQGAEQHSRKCKSRL